jgi:hypothetical protein
MRTPKATVPGFALALAAALLATGPAAATATSASNSPATQTPAAPSAPASSTSATPAPAALSVPAANTLVVNANQAMRPVTHVASGGLYGLAENGVPSESLIDPLKPKSFVQMAPGGGQLPNGEPAPAGDALVVAPEAARAGAQVIVRMPDWYPNFPYRWVSWSDWLSAVDQQVAAVKASGDRNIQAMEPWNEPDWTWDTADAGPFDAGWVTTVAEIRKDDPSIPIDGPSYSEWNESWMSSFLSYAKANDALPQYLSWHELQGDQNIAADVAACTALEASLGIKPIPIIIEEYATPTEVGVPGALVGYISKFERAGVDEADLAFWNEYGSMGDTLVATNGQPNAAWWLYKWYGDMSGQMVDTVPPAQTGIDGAASVNSARNQVSVIFGGGTGLAGVTVNGLSNLSAFGADAHVVLQYVRSQGRLTPSAPPQTLWSGDLPITGGSITVPVDSMNAANGYHLLITPAGTSAPGLDGTYKLQNAGSGRVLGVADASHTAGAAVVQGTGTTARDQLWDLVGTGTGAYKVVDENSGLDLGVVAASTSRGAAVDQLIDDGDAGELWTPVAIGRGEYKLVDRNSGMVLTAGGSTVSQQPYTGSPSQQWKLPAGSDITSGAYYTVTNFNSALNLDTQNAATAQGTPVLQEPADAAADQAWQFVAAGDGEYKIVNKASGLLLGINASSTTAGADAVIWGDDGTADHLWQVQPDGNGTYLITNANSGMVLGINAASTAAGQLALQWTDNGTPDHLWKLTQQ